MIVAKIFGQIYKQIKIKLMKQQEIYNKLKEVSRPYHSWTDQMESIAKWIHEHYEQKQNSKDDERKKVAAILFSQMFRQFSSLDWNNTIIMKAAAKRSLELADILLDEINNKSNGQPI